MVVAGHTYWIDPSPRQRGRRIETRTTATSPRRKTILPRDSGEGGLKLRESDSRHGEQHPSPRQRGRRIETNDLQERLCARPNPSPRQRGRRIETLSRRPSPGLPPILPRDSGEGGLKHLV